MVFCAAIRVKQVISSFQKIQSCLKNGSKNERRIVSTYKHSRVCTDQFTPQVTKAIRSKLIGGLPWKIPKNPNKV